MIYYSSGKDFKKKITTLIVSNLSDDETKEYKGHGKVPAKRQAERGNNKYNYAPDMVMPKGCVKLGWRRSTVVYIKYHILYGTIERVLFEYERSEYYKGETDLVVIWRYTPNVAFHPNNSYITVLSDKELLERLGDNWENERDREHPSNDTKFARCKQAFLKGNCSLFLGAGVSMSAGLPGWCCLLDRMKDDLLASEGMTVRSSDKCRIIRNCDNSALIEARYLEAFRDMSNNNKSYIDCVRDALYLHECGSDELLQRLADLIEYVSASEPNPKCKVKGVFTYNYDDLLESVLEKRNIDFEVRDGTRSECKRFPIYHVHGLIRKYSCHASYTADWVVLSERDYHDLFNYQHLWANNVQRIAMAHSTCIFVGMSMNDPNLRRLLAATRRGEDYRYAFLRSTVLSDSSLTGQNEKTMDKMFNDLGVHVIWYNDHSELPTLLHKLIV